MKRFLDFVRGGRMSFDDGKSYDVDDYRNAVATILRLFDEEPLLMTDDRKGAIPESVMFNRPALLLFSSAGFFIVRLRG